jgi:hypothetical protein
MAQHQLSLYDDEARLLLQMANEYADRRECDVEAQAEAFEAWLPAGRIAELVEERS